MPMPLSEPWLLQWRQTLVVPRAWCSQSQKWQPVRWEPTMVATWKVEKVLQMGQNWEAAPVLRLHSSVVAHIVVFAVVVAAAAT